MKRTKKTTQTLLEISKNLPKQKYKSLCRLYEVNHYNRLKSAFDSNGKIGVKAYVKKLIKPEFELQFFTRIDQLL